MTETSPQVRKKLTFAHALEEVANGKKITRLDWNTQNVYGHLKGDILMIHRDDTDKEWIISKGDMDGTDWVVIN